MTHPDLPLLNAVQAAIEKMAGHLSPVETENIPTQLAAGRFLGDALLADRDSPALDVSAMDGYAIRHEELSESGDPTSLPIAAVAAAGSAPVTLPPQQAIQIFTGAAVPFGANCVVRREDTIETSRDVTIQLAASQVRLGHNIRRQGENTQAGDQVLPAGTLLSPAAMSAAASFGSRLLNVRRRLRVVVLNTGDELSETGDTVAAWQIRDSNGPFLEAWLNTKPWIEMVDRRRVKDTLPEVVEALAAASPMADAILLTGGVSMGDTDHVPDAIRQLGGEIHFHRLPIRPGKPVLGAILNNTLLLGLPGNPVSVAVTARVIGQPLLERLGGTEAYSEPHPLLLKSADDKTLPLNWYRLVRLTPQGSAELVVGRGSGDLVSLAHSHGFVEVPPGASGTGPWNFYAW